MHTEVEFFFPVNFLSILNIIKEVIIKNKSNNYVSFFFFQMETNMRISDTGFLLTGCILALSATSAAK